jgi:multicomponent Na+:H+ antiporter subunit E
MSSIANTQPQQTGRSPWPARIRHLLLFALLWWILTGGSADSWIIGAPTIVLATWMSLTLWQRQPLSFVGLARFIPWFAYQSLVGATDVAFRALQPDMPLHPGLVRHRLRLPPGASRVTLANVVSMLAGTLSANLEDGELVIHALDARNDLHAMVDDLEPRIAALFGLALTSDSQGSVDQ